MGQTIRTICLSCEHEFDHDYGGGFEYDQLLCDQCGKEYGVEKNKILTNQIQCRCGGVFTITAKPRCPKCRSIDLKEKEVLVYYD